MVMERSSRPSWKKKKFSVADAVILIVLTILCISMLYPFLNLFYVSISDMSKITAAGGAAKAMRVVLNRLDRDSRSGFRGGVILRPMAGGCVQGRSADRTGFRG